MSRWWYLRLVISLAFLALLLWKAEPWRLGEVWTRLNLASVLLILLLNLPTPLLVTLRSRMVISKLGYKVSISSLLPIAFFGFWAGAITPARSGELLRVTMLKERHGIPMSYGIASVLYERLYSFYLMVLSTLAFASAVLWASHLAILLALMVGFAGLALVPTVFYPRLRGLFNRMPSLRPPWPLGSNSLIVGFREPWREGEGALAVLFGDAALAARFSVLTLLFFATSVLQFWLIASALDLSLSLDAAWLAWGAFGIAAILSLLPAGLGVGDGALVLVLARLGAGLDVGAAIAAMSRLLVHLPQGLGAIGGHIYISLRSPSSTRATQAVSPCPLPIDVAVPRRKLTTNDRL
jgi:uncharacterized membrane protein YbhN (UPF0104 family)